MTAKAISKVSEVQTADSIPEDVLNSRVRGRPTKYPLHNLVKQGQFITVTNVSVENARVAISKYEKKHDVGGHFAAREVKGGVEIWRLENPKAEDDGDDDSSDE